MGRQPPGRGHRPPPTCRSPASRARPGRLRGPLQRGSSASQSSASTAVASRPTAAVPTTDDHRHPTLRAHRRSHQRVRRGLRTSDRTLLSQRSPSPGATLPVPATSCRSRPRAVISPQMSTHLQQPITPEPVVDGLIDSSDPTRLAGQRPTPQYHGTVPPPFAAAGSSPPALRPNKTSSQVGSARRGRSDRYPPLSQAPRGRDRVEVAA